MSGKKPSPPDLEIDFLETGHEDRYMQEVFDHIDRVPDFDWLVVDFWFDSHGWKQEVIDHAFLPLFQDSTACTTLGLSIGVFHF